MIIETISFILLGTGLGIIIMSTIDKKKNISSKIKKNIDRKEIDKIINNPEKLKAAIDKNGEIYDFNEKQEYQKVSYDVENGKLVEKREVVNDPLKLKKPEEKEKTPGIPVKKPKKKTKTTVRKKQVKKTISTKKAPVAKKKK